MTWKRHSVLTIVYLCLVAVGRGEDTGPILIKPRGGWTARPRHIDVRSLVEAAHAKAIAARSQEEYCEVLRLIEPLHGEKLSPRATSYVNRLASWAHNMRGELVAAEAAEAEQSGRAEQAGELEAAALEDFEAAVRLDPDSWRALYHRAVSYGKAGRLDEAMEDLTAVIEREQQHANAWFNRAEIHTQLGQYAQAVEDYTQSLRLRPDDADVFAGRGYARQQLGQHEDALADLDEAVRLQPKNASIMVDRAALHAALGHWEQASYDYRAAIRLDDKMGRAYRGAAWLMATCPDPRYRNPKLALPAARKAIQLDGSDDYRYVDTLAAAHAAMGQFEKAKVSLAHAIESAPDEPAQRMKYRLALYEKEEPFHDQPAVAVSASFE